MPGSQALSKKPPSGADRADTELYARFDEMDHLEELLEEMDELRVTSRADVERRLAELHAQLDATDGSPLP